MPSFGSGGIEIAYQEAGEGPSILLVHGFASNGNVNWRDTGWIDSLTRAGRRVVAMDNRGHGASAKLYDPAAYAIPGMAEDARRLLDHLRIDRADIMGYSMGARIGTFLAIAHPERVRSLVLGGLADNLIRLTHGSEAIARALEAPSLADVTEPQARAFRLFADQTKSDRRALAACMRAPRQTLSEAELLSIRCPVLVVAGEKDDIAGPVAPLVAALPHARGVTLARRNHMNAVGDREFKAAVIEFLQSPEDFGASR